MYLHIIRNQKRTNIYANVFCFSTEFISNYHSLPQKMGYCFSNKSKIQKQAKQRLCWKMTQRESGSAIKVKGKEHPKYI